MRSEARRYCRPKAEDSFDPKRRGSIALRCVVAKTVRSRLEHYREGRDTPLALESGASSLPDSLCGHHGLVS